MEKEKLKIAFFGIGGIGGLVGGAVAKVHEETYFIARGKTLSAVRTRGVTVNSKILGDFTARPKAASDNPKELGVMDVFFVTCKGNALPDACRAIKETANEETVVIPLLNGVTVSDMLRPKLPPVIAADGIISVFSHIEEPGRVVQSYGPLIIRLGMKDGSKPERLTATVEILKEAGIDAKISENIVVDSWKKYLTMGGNSVLFGYYGGPAGVVRERADHVKVLRAVAGELTAVARAEGVTLPADLTDKFVDNFENLSPEAMSSLYRDLSSGKAAKDTELAHVIGRMVELGEKNGVPTPYYKKVYDKYKDQGSERL